MAGNPELEPVWFVLKLNPEPWRIGPVSAGRAKNGGMFARVGADSQLVAYQKAVQEAIKEGLLVDYEVTITFYFWRQLASYTTLINGRKVVKHTVDATNMQKATEDALQGILIINDEQVRDVRSVIVERQGQDVDPMVVIKFERFWGFDIEEIPTKVWNQIERYDKHVIEEDNSWPPRS